MKTGLAIGLIAIAIVFAGCGESAPPGSDPNLKAKPIEASSLSQADLQAASDVARSAPSGWASLTAEQKQPFLKLNGNEEAKAKNHYEALVETEREVMAAQGVR